VTATVTRDDKTVNVNFELSDTPLSPDTYNIITVELLKNGEVWGLSYFWQEPSVVGEYPIISETEALEWLKDCKGDIFSQGNDMSVTDVRLVYLGVPFAPSGVLPYQYLIPAYSFTNNPENRLEIQSNCLDTQAGIA